MVCLTIDSVCQLPPPLHMVMMLQVNGEYFGHNTMSMNLDPSQHHHLHNHHASMAAMQMPMNPGDGMM